MRSAGEELAKSIESIEWSEPSQPLIQNATAASADSLPSLLAHLKAHVYNPVYWTKTIESLRDKHGVKAVVEAGPGKVLTGLGKRIDRSLPTYPIDSPSTLAAALDALAVA